MGCVDRGEDAVGDHIAGEEVDEDKKIPAQMIDEEPCVQSQPHMRFLCHMAYRGSFNGDGLLS